MRVVRTRDELGAARAGLDGASVGFVPTMGFLHDGHLSLVELAREASDGVVVSIYVNPTQFGPSEDLDAYPRDEARDLALLEERGVDLVFLPTDAVIYADGEPGVTVDPGPMARGLCGRHRPGHFRGVLTVVAKLFGLVRPDRAAFGEKDFQQLVLVERMARDLELGVEILRGPVVREEDGLALSSRNAYLSPEERAQATGLHRALVTARERVAAGVREPEVLAGELRAGIDAHPLLETQYAEIVDPETLAPVERVAEGSRAAVAAFCGKTRLIDNMELL